MKLKSSASIITAAVTMFSLSTAIPAFSETNGINVNEHSVNNNQMMEMENMDRMADITAICIQHASIMGLTDDQIEKIKPLHIQIQKKHAQYRADKKKAKTELKEIIIIKDFDIEMAGNSVRKIADIQTDHHLDILKNMKAMRSILTESQFKKIKMIMSKQSNESKPAKKTD